jgi:hypothetical protein
MSWRSPRRSTSVTSLDLHPNLAEILGILTRVPQLTDREVTGLAHAWRDTTYLSLARDHALRPDSPLVIDVLAAFGRVDTVFDEELTGDAVTVALKAVRDALAAAYAKPVLARAEYAALMSPWRRVFAVNGEPGPSKQADAVQDLLDAFAPLATRCHDENSRALFSQLAQAAVDRDDAVTAAARDTAWKIALGSARRRQWRLLRQSVHEALTRPCRTCKTWRRPLGESVDAGELVRSLCVDAVCGMLMADSVGPEITSALVGPILPALPGRSASEE